MYLGFSDYDVIGPHYNPGICCPGKFVLQMQPLGRRRGLSPCPHRDSFSMSTSLIPGDGEIDTWYCWSEGAQYCTKRFPYVASSVLVQVRQCVVLVPTMVFKKIRQVWCLRKVSQLEWQ